MHQTAARACQCGHDHQAHEHYRRSLDCSLCPGGQCASFRTTTAVRSLAARLRRHPAAELVGTAAAPVAAPAGRPHLSLVR